MISLPFVINFPNLLEIINQRPGSFFSKNKKVVDRTQNEW